MTAVDCEHFAGHAFIALMSPFAVIEEAYASILHCHLIRCGPVDSRVQLAFDVDAEGVGSFLGLKVFPLSMAAIIGVIHNPRGLEFAGYNAPATLANRCHYHSPLYKL
jgi:hypothetical protein